MVVYYAGPSQKDNTQFSRFFKRLTIEAVMVYPPILKRYPMRHVLTLNVSATVIFIFIVMYSN